MANLVFRQDPGANILQPAMPSGFQRMDPFAFAASIQITRGQAVARKTSNGLAYPLNLNASDGTQTFAGFSAYSLATDASGNIYLVAAGSSAGSNYYVPLATSAPVWTGGIFDPNDLITGYTSGTLTAEIDTVVIGGTVAANDVYEVNSILGGSAASYLSAGSSATTVATQLTSAWNADPALAAVATATSSNATMTITGVNTASYAGRPLGLTVGKTSTSGTITLANTTAGVSAQTAEVDTFTLSTNPTTGDVPALTITYPGSTNGYLGNTLAVPFTVGATQTVAAVTAGLKAAWNANPQAAAYATATSTSTTVVLTAVVSGSAMSVAFSSTGSTTASKAVTTPAFGRNITDILAGAPGSHILQSSGYWAVY